MKPAPLVLAIDPGPEQSAYVLWDGKQIHEMGKEQNADVLHYVRDSVHLAGLERLVIEQIASYGMAVGAEVFETCVWTGRFMEAFSEHYVDRIPRKTIVTNLCGSSKAKDANVRQSIIDRFGGKAKAIGNKANPGPLYGVSGDVWSALAVALTWQDMNRITGRAA